MTQSVLNIVRHQGGLFRLGVVGKEYKGAARRIILKGFSGLKKTEFNPTKAYYRYGSLFSKEIHNWLVTNHYTRGPKQDIWLIKVEFNATAEGDHVFTFFERSKYVKVPHKNILKAKTKVKRYSNGALVSEVWTD